MSISKRVFGVTADGRTVSCWRLTNSSGACVEVLDFGAATRAVEVFDRSVCMSFDSVARYEARTTYSGAIIGRHAGRIGGAEFELNGRQYKLAVVDGPNHHHGGLEGFSHKVWSVEADGEKLVCRYTSPDGEEGYPGTLTITVTYQWTADSTLTITLDAICDRDTIASFTHHGYWNLSGEDTVGSHRYQVHAPTVAAGDENTLATGELMDVSGTPFDFRTPKVLEEVWNDDHPQIIPNCGFDHTFPVPGEGLRELGSLSSDDLKLTVSSTLPALHIYTGVGSHAALEAQFIPDAVHHSNFPSSVLRAGEHWHHTIEYNFTHI